MVGQSSSGLAYFKSITHLFHLIRTSLPNSHVAVEGGGERFRVKRSIPAVKKRFSSVGSSFQAVSSALFIQGVQAQCA